MRTRALALPAIIFVTALTLIPTLTFAQHRQNPINPTNPGSHRPPPVNPITILSVSPPPANTAPTESIITDFNTGRIYMIQQSGDQVIILSPSN